MKNAMSFGALLAAVFLAVHPALGETLTVKISGLKGTSGVVRVMIWKDAVGFPTKPEKSVAQKAVPVSGPEAEVVFSGLAKGTYAVAGYHDVNNNGHLDISMFGWPIEPTASSNGARGLMGPPRFNDAAFELKQPAQTIPLIFQ